MKYSVVFSSKTGNTAKLAMHLQAILKEQECVYFGTPNEKALDADFIFVGFWTDKGTSNEEISMFLNSLEGKNIYLFGTAGFGGKKEYFDGILNRVKEVIMPTNTILGTFMCQGKMPQSVRTRYEEMLAKNPENDKVKELIENFDQAIIHPTDLDIARFGDDVKDLF
ncbi:flavodoxin [Lachnospiraceae bacterium KM106-2]|nr:flavodoxin [Lachnospiraceae bacterium KM106-2]